MTFFSSWACLKKWSFCRHLIVTRPQISFGPWSCMDVCRKSLSLARKVSSASIRRVRPHAYSRLKSPARLRFSCSRPSPCSADRRMLQDTWHRCNAQIWSGWGRCILNCGRRVSVISLLSTTTVTCAAPMPVRHACPAVPVQERHCPRPCMNRSTQFARPHRDLPLRSRSGF
jgi:hypothetical protein